MGSPRGPVQHSISPGSEQYILINGFVKRAFFLETWSPAPCMTLFDSARAPGREQPATFEHIVNRNNDCKNPSSECQGHPYRIRNPVHLPFMHRREYYYQYVSPGPFQGGPGRRVPPLPDPFKCPDPREGFLSRSRYGVPAGSISFFCPGYLQRATATGIRDGYLFRLLRDPRDIPADTLHYARGG